MTTRDLDRLVSKTELSPLSKLALRRVRRAIAEGEVTRFEISKHKWSVTVANHNGMSCTWTFTMKGNNGNT